MNRSINPVAITMVAIGSAAIVAGLLVAAIGFVPASSALDAACPQHRCTMNAENRDLYDRTQGLGWAANVTLAVGAMWAIAGGAWLLAERFDDSREHVTVSMAVGIDGVAFVATGRF